MAVDSYGMQLCGRVLRGETAISLVKDTVVRKVYRREYSFVAVELDAIYFCVHWMGRNTLVRQLTKWEYKCVAIDRKGIQLCGS